MPWWCGAGTAPSAALDAQQPCGAVDGDPEWQQPVSLCFDVGLEAEFALFTARADGYQ